MKKQIILDVLLFISTLVLGVVSLRFGMNLLAVLAGTAGLAACALLLLDLEIIPTDPK